MHWRIGNRTLDLTHRGLIMGIINVTPDSFSDGGRFTDPGRAVEGALAMVADGADIQTGLHERPTHGEHLRRADARLWPRTTR